MNSEDTYILQGARKKLVTLLRNKGIKDKNVLNAIQKVKRHLFLPKEFEKFAYQDRAFPIDHQQTISQPYTVAFQSELLEIQPNDKILEIGTGSGYQAAVLATMTAEVYSIEYIKELSMEAQEILRLLDLKVNCKIGDGSKGWKEHAPYNKIIVTAGAPNVPSDLLSQLKIGGILIIPSGDLKTQTMIKVVRKDHNNFTKSTHGNFVFVPLKGANGFGK